MKKPLISIIIVNHNGEKFLNSLFNSLLNINYPNFEIIFVDNASTDRSLRILKKFTSKLRIKIVKSRINLGHPGGCLKGLKHTKGKFIAFLDVDTRVRKNWLTELVDAIASDKKIGIVQSKLLQMCNPKKIDSFGCFLDHLGYAYEDERGKDEKMFKEKREVFHANTASILLRGEVYRKLKKNDLELFNPYFFMYYDDTEASWKVRLLGYKVVVSPSSIALHQRGIISFKGASYNLVFHLTKNRIFTLIECYSTLNVLRFVPLTISLEFLRGLLLFFVKPTHTVSIFKGILWVFLNLGKVLEERRKVQRIRKVRDEKIIGLMKKVSLIRLLKHQKEKYSTYQHTLS